MNNISYNNLKEDSIFLKFFGQDKTIQDSANDIILMNDNWFVKKLEDNYVSASIYDLKNTPYNKRQDIIKQICISELQHGTNVQFAEGQVWRRDDLSFEEGHYMSVKATRMALSTLVREHTEKLSGKYILLVHPDVAKRLKKELKAKLIGEVLNVIIVEMSQLPIYKNAVGEDIYCSFLLGDYAFGVKVFEEQGICGIRRINERRMVRIETVA